MIGRQCALLTGLHNTIVKYPSVFCTKKCLYLNEIDVKNKGCRVPNRKRKVCRYLLLLTADESKHGLSSGKEAKFAQRAEKWRMERKQWEENSTI